MVGVRFLDHGANTRIRQKTQTEGTRYKIQESDHRWAGRVTRKSGNRWTPGVTVCEPRLFQRGRGEGRPGLRWTDDLVHQFGMQ